MKEQYVKPVIFFENFSLTQTIARNCGDAHDSTIGESTHYDEETCTWVLGDFTVFFGHCEYDIDEEGEIEGFCYNNPDGGQGIFSSI